MNGAIVIRWGQGVPGREAKGMEVFGAAVGRFEALAKQGRIHGHREFFGVTGGYGGFMIADGELTELSKIVTEPETLALNNKAASIVEDFDVALYAGGTDQTIQELMGDYTRDMQEVGLL
jgi:hypothetical protein